MSLIQGKLKKFPILDEMRKEQIGERMGVT